MLYIVSYEYWVVQSACHFFHYYEQFESYELELVAVVQSKARLTVGTVTDVIP
jgi:hypothetical protein